jgi:hypothetical protein
MTASVLPARRARPLSSGADLLPVRGRGLLRSPLVPRARLLVTPLLTLAVACAPQRPAPPPAPAGLRPLGELGGAAYQGLAGGHYPGGEDMPAPHREAGLARARAVAPLDVEGKPSDHGKIVLLSIGMSNTALEFCSTRRGQCAPESFVGQAEADPEVRAQALALVDGALGGKTASAWDEPTDATYDVVRRTRLEPRGLSERQVQVVWLKEANPGPRASLPAADADARRLSAALADVVRAARAHYPNLALVFVSNRIYGGYARTPLNPEPFAYESGFAVKWLVEAQIQQMASPGRRGVPPGGRPRLRPLGALDRVGPGPLGQRRDRARRRPALAPGGLHGRRHAPIALWRAQGRVSPALVLQGLALHALLVHRECQLRVTRRADGARSAAYPETMRRRVDPRVAPRFSAAAVLLAAIALGACSASSDGAEGRFGEGGGRATSGAGSTSGDTSSGAGGGLLTGGATVGAGGGAPAGCGDAATDYIYILGEGKELYRFQPVTLALEQIAILSCPGEAVSSTFSMAVDRSGTAWVLFADGEIFHVSTIDGSCSSTSYVAGQNGLFTFGMGFVADGPGSTSETLYIGTPSGLGRIDTTTLASSLVGAYDSLPAAVAEMTGTGDGRLFGYFTLAPVKVAEIDKTNAHVISVVDLPQIPSGTSWAFAFWGGTFWLFNGAEIRSYSEQSGLQLVNPNVGFQMVGAGVSTCAPVTPPS